jgi:tetratricopeptide (TPR) repeat protein
MTWKTLRRRLLVITIGLVALAPASRASTDSLEILVRNAVDFMDRNLPAEAEKNWVKVIAARPDVSQYKYERAICLIMQQKYADAAQALQPIYTDTALFDRGYQLLGNCYDLMDDSARSMPIYREGLVRYPRSGRLHYELGAAAMVDGEIRQAFEWWVKGTQAEPQFPTNYYWICKSLSATQYKIWSVFYGELFLNLERATTRTKEISEILYITWTAAMRLGDTVDPINFCPEELLDEPSPFGPTEMNFATAFEFTVATSSQKFIPDSGVVKRLSIAQLVETRRTFIKAWEAAGYLTKYPNAIFDWHAKMAKSGWLDEYLWWLYAYGDKKEMTQYFRKNEGRYDTFLGWFMSNGMDFSTAPCVGYSCSK